MKYPDETSLIMVALIPKPKDLEIARVLGWYRIPLRRAPKVIGVDYIAFYQPGSFGARGGQIEFFARVRGHELVTRGTLFRDEVSGPKAREEYFKIQLGAVTPLIRPIPAKKWKRITFLYTTGAYLLTAQSVDDLVVGQEDRPVLWRALRERGKENDNYQIFSSDQLKMDPDIERFLSFFGKRLED